MEKNPNLTSEKEAQSFLKIFLDNLPYPIFVKRAQDGSFVYMNKAEEKLAGLSAKEALNKTDYDLIGMPKEQAEFFRKMDQEVFKKGTILIIPEEPLFLPHLGNRILRTTKTPIYDENGEPLFLLGISEDVTEIKKTEEELKKYREHLEELVAERTEELARINRDLETEITERKLVQKELADSKSFLDKIINSISDPVFVKNRKHQWVLINDSLCVFLGHKKEDLLGKTDFDFFPEKEAQVFWEMDEKVLLKGEENLNEETITDAQGMTHVISTKKTLYRDDHGESFIVGVFRDITELKLAEEELKKHRSHLEDQVKVRTAELFRQKEELRTALENLQKTQEQLVESEKMAAVGGLVAGVSHEINTPIGIGVTAISNLLGDIQRIAGLFQNDEISREDFRNFLETSDSVARLIQKNLERTVSLVQSFKQVSVDQVTEQQRVFAFREYVDDIIASLRPKFRGKKIDLQIICDDNLKLNSFPGVFAQIFTNLILNSLQHGFNKKEGGTIMIHAELDKDVLKIRYEDDGKGIGKKDLPHIFEPFYTTDHNLGTGLGLNIIYNLIRQKLHGNIVCESREGKGVLFAIEVPVPDAR